MHQAVFEERSSGNMKAVNVKNAKTSCTAVTAWLACLLMVIERVCRPYCALQLTDCQSFLWFHQPAASGFCGL